MCRTEPTIIYDDDDMNSAYVNILLFVEYNDNG